MKKILLGAVVILGVSGLWWMTQNREGTAPSTPGLLSSLTTPKNVDPFATPLVSFVPRDVNSLQRCDYSSASFKRYLESPLATIALSYLKEPDKIRTSIETLSGGKTLEEANIPQLGAALNKLKEITKAFTETEGFQDPYYAKDALVFQRPTTAQTPVSFAVVFFAERKMDLAGLVGKLRGLGANITDVSEAGLQYYTYNLMDIIAAFAGGNSPFSADAIPKAVLHFGQVDNRFAMGTTQEDILPFLQNKPFPTPPDLLTTEYAKATIGRIGFNPKVDYCYQYGDYRRVLRDMVAQLESMGTAGQPQDEQTKKGLDILRNLPLLGYSSSMRYDDGFDVSGSLGFEEKSEHFNLGRWLKYFTTSKASATTSLLPATSFWVFGINTSDLFKGLREALALIPSPMPPDAEPTIAAVEAVNSIAIAINYVSGEALFPDLTIAIDSKSPDALVTQLRAIPSKIPQSGALGGWIEKNIEGTKVAFIASPFGVGAFFATIDNHLVIASSEVAIRRAILIGRKKEKSLAETLTMRSLPAGENALAFLYFDMPRLIETVEGLKGSLGAFIPPDQQQQFGIPPMLRELFDAVGALSFEVSVKGTFLDFRAKQKVIHRGAAV